MASPQPEKSAPTLFISYSHDSLEHEDQVRALADRLRQDGINTLIDQYDMAPPVGWPMWMDREIQKADFVALICTETYLKRVEGREDPGKGRGVLWEAKLIYNLLYLEDSSKQRFIPILFTGGTSASIPLPLRGSTYYEVSDEEGYEDFYRHLTNQPRYEKPGLGKLKPLHAISPQSYPASLGAWIERKSPTTLDQRNRLQMLRRVHMDWIDGVLRQSLYNVARIELGLQTKAGAVEQPLKAIVQIPDQPATLIPKGTKISQVFDSYGNSLLILGAPGTGKTTVLLELAEQLLDRAGQDENHPIPVVFNLSSWAVRRLPLNQWMVSELNERSDVPKSLAQRWIESEQIIPLLDGLDEVAADRLESCVEKINDFRRDHGLLPIAVCSRMADYDAVGTKLRLRSAVVVQTLTRSEVQSYLEQAGDLLLGLRRVLNSDSTLWELFETPLMLWVAMLAYPNVTPDFSLAGTIEQRRKQLLATFVNEMFKRRPVEAHFSSRQTVSALRWLAFSLSNKNQTTLYLEDLNEYCTSQDLLRSVFASSHVIATFVFALLFAAITGITKAMLGSSILSGITTGLILGMAVGQLGQHFDPMLDPRPVQIRMTMANIARRVRKGIGVGWGVGVLVAMIAYGNLVGFSPKPDAALKGLALSSLFGLTTMLLVVTAMAFLFGEANEIEHYARPNQGTRRSLQTALTVALIMGLLSGMFVRIVSKTSLGFGISEWLGGLLWLYCGLIGGAISGLFSGGYFAIKHWATRWVLSMNQLAPLRYVRFLDYAAERLFLRRVGGGYIFVHRMLLEYFASLPKQADSK